MGEENKDTVKNLQNNGLICGGLDWTLHQYSIPLLMKMHLYKTVSEVIAPLLTTVQAQPPFISMTWICGEYDAVHPIKHTRNCDKLPMSSL